MDQRPWKSMLFGEFVTSEQTAFAISDFLKFLRDRYIARFNKRLVFRFLVKILELKLKKTILVF